MTKGFAPLGIAAFLLVGDIPAQEFSVPELGLPRAVGAPSAIGLGSKQRLLLLIRNRNWPEASRLTEGLAPTAAGDSQLHYLIGVVRWQQGDNVGAIRRFRTAELLGLREPYLHKALGVAYYEAHQYLLFEQQMARASGADQSDPQPDLYLGRYVESVKGDFAGALRHFERVIALDPDHARGHSYFAYCLERLDRLDAAAEHYRTSVQLLQQANERFSWPYQGLARLTLKTDPQEARAWALKAVAVEPTLFEAHALLARAHDGNGEFGLAVDAASEAVRLNPNHAASHYLLFTVHRKLGNSGAARRHMSRFQELKEFYGDQ